MDSTYNQTHSSVNPVSGSGTNQNVIEGESFSSSEVRDVPLRDEKGQTCITCPPQLVTGIDTLDVSIWLEWPDHSFLELVDERKQIVQETNMKSLSFNFWGIDFNIHRTGRNLFPYHLSRGDAHLLLNNRSSTDSFCTGRIEVGSISCWSPGYIETFDYLLRFLEVQGAKLIRETVSRVDLACDTIDISLSQTKVDDQSRWVKRAKQFSIHHDGNTLSGITLGKGDIMLRIYDKVKELKDKQATSKQELFSKLWKQEKFDHLPVTRTEFQLRRPILNQFSNENGNKVNTVAEIKNSLQTLWEYCTQQWARHACKSVDRENNNQKHIENSSFWQLVSSAQFSGSIVLKRLLPVPKINIDPLIAQGTGCLLTVAAAAGHDVDDIDGIAETIKKIAHDQLKKFHKDRYSEFSRRFCKRRNDAIGLMD
ncbi:hypothetical protein [Desulfogranum marinum]|uniref:hypothetical protein n=1 Tax=Desulfogranum marinum TaxID=453220 RepID=UPI0029C86E99|nr:hypothetical protein [Desulfogranum marinum]